MCLCREDSAKHGSMSGQMIRLYRCAGDGESLVDALPPGKGIYDLEQDDIEKQEAPTDAAQRGTVADNMTGFSTAVGNGIFWLIPFIMYFVPLDIVGFSLYDNGRLDDDLRRYAQLPHAVVCAGFTQAPFTSTTALRPRLHVVLLT